MITPPFSALEEQFRRRSLHQAPAPLAAGAREQDVSELLDVTKERTLS
jgi:hypothetical protein